MQAFKLTLLGVVSLLAFATQLHADEKANESPRDRQCFDDDWLFLQGDVNYAHKPEFDDNAWRPLDLPHDWSVEGPFDKSNPSGAPGAYLPCGTGWYRKHFTLPAAAAGKRIAIEFDGVYMNGEVWINGRKLGRRPYGYVGYQYDMTPHLNLEGENVVAVRVDNYLQPSSRWYTGSGIYRHVWLTMTDPLRVAHWGTQVTTPTITDESAEVAIVTEVRNGYEVPKTVTVTQTIVDPKGNEVALVTEDIEVAESKSQSARQSLKISEPMIWSPESPNLYTMRTELYDGDRLVDRYETTFGVRTFKFDPNKGLILNGEQIIMKGMCNHHDLGPLGAALWDDAWERRLVMLKEMGCNSIRTAHNPSSPELLEMCDRLGFLVINETFDEWRRGWSFENGTLVSSKKPKGKAKFGYNRLFDRWAERDLTDHMKRDRNHPSIIMWSVGNEVPEAQKYGELETLEWLQGLVHQLDPTRPATVGCNFIAGANESGFASLMEIAGYNGGGGSCFQYEADHLKYPERIIYASEVPHTLQTRGEYRTHSKYREKKYQPANLTKEEVFPETHPRYESSYDNAGVRISARDSWHLTKTLPYVAGEFRWTGFDYLGESGGWPRVIGNFGIIDLCNFPKDTYYFYQSQWTDKPMLHLLPHWTWPGKEGTEIPVWCYTNCDSVELFLNGESLGKREFNDKTPMHLEWMVPYEAGELKAVATKDGKEIATSTARTAGPPARIALEADRTKLRLGQRDLSYVTVRVEDEQGTMVPRAALDVQFEVSGSGRLVAVGSGDPMSHESFQGSNIKTFNGLALAILTSTNEAGSITLKATAEGLPAAEVQISVVPSAD